MGFSRASRITPDILQLAGQHDLVCYDPGEIDGQVRRLTRANWYAWLEREEGAYVQVGLGVQSWRAGGQVLP